MRFWLLLLATAASTAACAQEPLIQRENNYSLRNESVLAIDKGLAWLREHQNAHGTWGQPTSTLQTGLALTAFLRQPIHKYDTDLKPEFLEKSLDYFREGLQRHGYLTQDPSAEAAYVIARVLTATNLSEWNGINKNIEKNIDTNLRAAFPPPPKKNQAKAATEAHQPQTSVSFEEAFRMLETLYLISLGTDSPSYHKDPSFSTMIDVLSKLQCLRTPKSTISKSTDYGGFACDPDGTRQITIAWKATDHACALSTYTGLFGLISGGLKPTDSRVTAALDWIGRHYTLQENAGMGSEGYYRSLNRMAKALSLAKIRDLSLTGGRKIDWAREETLKIMDLQNIDGSWMNRGSQEQMESDPVFVTAEMVLTLELLYYEL